MQWLELIKSLWRREYSYKRNKILRWSFSLSVRKFISVKKIQFYYTNDFAFKGEQSNLDDSNYQEILNKVWFIKNYFFFYW